MLNRQQLIAFSKQLADEVVQSGHKIVCKCGKDIQRVRFHTHYEAFEYHAKYIIRDVICSCVHCATKHYLQEKAKK